ncbi:MAG: glycosyltransferase family 39 protein [Verrucomicrobiales bacterium]
MRAVFLVVLILLGFYYLFVDFRGLSDAKGIEQAQIGREIARGHGFTTKTIRPVSLYQARSVDPETPLVGFKDTFHAPLNPLLNSVFLLTCQSAWDYEPEVQGNEENRSAIYLPDRVIAAVSALLLFCSIGITYLLVSRIFDAKIGGVTAILMLLCQLLWKFAQSGLPQNLLLFLFCFATYFLYKAVEMHNQGKSPWLWIALTGGFFGLLALAHWLTVWIFLGAIVFVAAYFRPRGVLAIMMAAIFLAIISFWGYHNYKNSGSIVGSGIYSFYSGLNNGEEEWVMRNADPKTDDFSLDGLPTKLVYGSLRQVNDLYSFLGSIVAAPLFFLSLLHAFRRREIANFRWCLLLMWVFGVGGMSLFGIRDPLEANQLHVLFIPLMTAYGLAIVSVLWHRLGLPMHAPMVRNGHFTIIILISAMPFLLTLVPSIIRGMYTKERVFKANWPPYMPAVIAELKDITEPNEVIVSDMPWAVAWYADRISVWTPRTMDQFESLVPYAEDKGTPVAGLHFSPLTTNKEMGSELFIRDRDWAALASRMAVAGVTRTPDAPEGLDIMGRQEFRFARAFYPMIGHSMFFYSDRDRRRLKESRAAASSSE